MSDSSPPAPTGPSAALEAARSLVHGLPDPAILYDAELAPLYFNAHFARMSGKRPRRLWRMIHAGRFPFEFVARPGGDEADRLRGVMASARPVTLPEERIRTDDGTEATVMPTCIPVLDDQGRCVGAISSFRDVSAEARVHARYKELIAAEKARAEELERQVEERTRQLTVALEEVTRLSRVDPLTQTLNRRAFYDLAGKALSLAHRHDRSAALLMCDLDHFKQVNDTYGHPTGDKILEEVAEALRGSLRDTDQVGRFGGEEFVVLLTETQAEHVLQVAKRCLEAVRAIPVSDLIPEMGRRQTVSIGAAVFPDHGDNLDDLIRRGDEALYEAKRAGRNRAVLYEPGGGARPPGPLAQSAEQDVSRVLFVAAGSAQAEANSRRLVGDYDIVPCSSIEAATALLRERPFAAVVAEQELEGGSGIEFLRKSFTSAPGAIRVLVLPSRDALLALRRMSAAHADELVVSGEGPHAIAAAIEQGKLRRDLSREEFFGAPASITGVHAGHLAALRQVLDEGAVDMRAQPLVSADDSSAILGYQVMALARDAMLVEPAAAMYTAAARTGSLWELGRLVRRRAAEGIASLPDRALVFVALHPGEVSDPELSEGSGPLCAHSDRVVIQITDRATVPDARGFFTGLQRLRGLGFRLSITDFGAGSASVGAVASLVPDYVKVSRELIRGLSDSQARRHLIHNLVGYCADKGIAVIADGIDTREDGEAAAALGCRILQGAHVGSWRPYP